MIIGWHKSIVSSDYCWILLYLSFTILYIWSLIFVCFLWGWSSSLASSSIINFNTSWPLIQSYSNYIITGKVSIGLTATTIVSQWTWSATLLQSSTVASKVRKTPCIKQLLSITLLWTVIYSHPVWDTYLQSPCMRQWDISMNICLL